jgi:hypothetical protein
VRPLAALAALALCVPLLAGCANSMRSTLEDKAEGTVEAYPIPPADAVRAARDVLWEASRVDPEWDEVENLLFLKGGLGDNVTFVAVWVEPREKPGECLVTAVVRRASGMQFGVILTEDEFHERFRRQAGIRRAPKP